MRNETSSFASRHLQFWPQLLKFYMSILTNIFILTLSCQFLFSILTEILNFDFSVCNSALNFFLYCWVGRKWVLEKSCPCWRFLLSFFIGPRFHHSLPKSVTDCLTHILTNLLKLEWIDVHADYVDYVDHADMRTMQNMQNQAYQTKPFKPNQT